jgi:hypothetical protein
MNCLNCKSELKKPWQKKFCSSSCNATYTNKLKPRRSKESREKTGKSVKLVFLKRTKEKKEKIKEQRIALNRLKRELKPKISAICLECGEIYFNKNKKYCSNRCRLKTIGGLTIGGGRGKKCWYESPIAGKVYLRSSYELEYAKWLDSKKINWIVNKKSFEYKWEGKIRKYYPDFYLIDKDLFIEIKGYKIAKDNLKWAVVPNLKILYGQDLLKLGLNIKYLSV